MQTHLLHQRDAVHQRAIEEMNIGRDVVMDSSVWQDMAYAKMLHSNGVMTDMEYSTYLSFARLIERKNMLPDVCVYLKVPVMECYSRIQERMDENAERSCESAIDTDYLQGLEKTIWGNIQNNPSTVVFPWGDYLPAKRDRLLRIRNLWCLTEDLNTHIVLRN